MTAQKIENPKVIQQINAIIPDEERTFRDDTEYWYVRFYDEYAPAPIYLSVSAVFDVHDLFKGPRLPLKRSAFKLAKGEAGSFWYFWDRTELPERCYIRDLGGRLMFESLVNK